MKFFSFRCSIEKNVPQIRKRSSIWRKKVWVSLRMCNKMTSSSLCDLQHPLIFLLFLDLLFCKKNYIIRHFQHVDLTWNDILI
jgi:hypothetical protein